MASDLILEVRNLNKSFFDNNQEKQVLKSISLSAEKREVISILGPSGSGKSTLLRCINFLEIPSSGEIVLSGVPIKVEMMGHVGHTRALPRDMQKKINGLRKRISMVFQHFNLWSHLSVLENIIEAPITVLKQNKKEAVDRAEKLLKKVGLENYGKYYPSQISGGQKQRVAIARALAMDPEIILFDEPTSSLDPELVQEVLKVINELKEEEITMLIVSHEVQFSKDVSNRTLFLYQGEIEEFGPTEKIFKNPSSEKFKRFLSSLNLR